jgi:hypothetical protein
LEAPLLTNVHIENFCGVRTMDLPFAPVTALLGPNSSGKTTALHAVRLACALLERSLGGEAPVRVVLIDGVSWIEVAADLVVADGASLLSLSDWQALFVDQGVAANTAARVELRFDAPAGITALRVSLRCGRNAQLMLSVHVQAEEALRAVEHLPRRSARVSQTLSAWLGAHAPRSVFVPPFYGTVPNEELRSRAVIDRMLGAGDQSHVVRNLVASLSAAQLTLLNTFLQAVVGARIESRTSGDALQAEPALRVMFADTNGPLELSAAGAGLVNLVALYAALARWSGEADRRPVIFLVDEPEAHLSPMVQAEAAARMAGLVTREFRAQLVLATHSVDILNRLHREGAQLVRCDRSAPAPSAQVLGTDAALFGDLAAWADLTPYTAINFLASRKLLFVEGKTDLSLLPIFAALHYRNDPERLRRFRRWAIVELGGASRANEPALLARLLAGQAVTDRARGGSFAVLTVLDRDFERAPGWSADAEADGVSAATLVWSHHSIESLLVQPATLTVWLRAWLGDGAPADLGARVEAAAAAVDGDAALKGMTVEGLVAAFITAAVRSGRSLTDDHGRFPREATAEALRRATDNPAVWQRGKDRARVMLRHLREGLRPGPGDQMPVDVGELVKRVDLLRVPHGAAALPAEVIDLLERMARA